MTFLRTKTTAVWAGLIMATFLSWWFGSRGLESNGEQRLVGATVILIAFVKVRLVGLYFMEIRQGPAALRLLYEGWCLIAAALVIGMYLAT